MQLKEFTTNVLEDPAYPSATDYLRLIELWCERAVHDFAAADGAPERDHWYGGEPRCSTMRTAGNFAAVAALMAREGTDYDRWAGPAAAVLRTLTSHLHVAPEGTNLSALWDGEPADNLALDFGLPVSLFPHTLAARLLWPWLEEPLRAEVARLAAAVADALATIPIRASTDGNRSRPESNAWCGEYLLNTCHLLPDHPDNGLWRERALCFFVNSLSRASDARERTVVDDRPVSERFVGANVHPHFVVEHHGFFHHNYVFHPFERLAVSRLLCRLAGEEPPDATLWNVRGVFGVAKKCFRGDGRLMYPAGQDWGRYLRTKCFLLPACVMIWQDLQDPHARWMERLCFKNLHWEQDSSQDGYFFSKRIARDSDELIRMHFFEESNAGLNLSTAYLMHRIGTAEPPDATADGFEANYDGVLIEEDANLVVSSRPECFASFSFRAHRNGANGLFVPAGAEHAAEWVGNMLPRFQGEGIDFSPETNVVEKHELAAEEDGFEATGRLLMGQKQGEPALAHSLSYQLLPDGRTAVLQSLTSALTSLTLTEAKHLCFLIANDVFNGELWTLHTDKGSLLLLPDSEEVTVQTTFLNLADRLTVVPVTKDHSALMTIEKAERHDRHRTLRAHLVACPSSTERRSFEPGEVVHRSTFVFLAGLAHDEVRRYLASTPPSILRSVGDHRLSARVATVDGAYHMAVLEPPRGR